ncbi:hypothetical protein AB0911_26160 [Streptomyces nigra]|uniref:hypothetical protein n=1 Tax=Streptomyces nigra TaxID=1827580 RepID=UPI003453EF9C
MSEEVERASALVPVQYHQFDISDEDTPTGPDLDRRHNGLVRVIDGVIVVVTGIHTGNVDVTVTLHLTEPALTSDRWQEIVEISARSLAGELMIRGVLDDLHEELPILSFQGPGEYRLRIHARGRDTAVDCAPNEVTEWYLIQAWPSPAREATVLRQTRHPQPLPHRSRPG